MRTVISKQQQGFHLLLNNDVLVCIVLHDLSASSMK